MSVGQPDLADVHVNGLLSNLSIAYTNEMGSYVADQVFPLVYVPKQSDIYPVYGRGSFFADPGAQMVRAPGAPTPLTGYTIDNSNTYFALNYAIGAEIPDELRANADNPFPLDSNATLLTSEIQMIRRERAFSADFMKTGVWTATGSDGAVSNKWSDYAASDPITDIRTAIRAVQTDSGRRANKLVMGRIVWDRLCDHPDLVGRINGGATLGNAAIPSRQLLAQILEIDSVLVSDAVYNSAAENLAVSMARIVDDDALLLYTPSAPGLMIPAAGYTFVWESAMNGSRAPQFMRKWRDDKQRRDVVEAHAYWDQVATSAVSGYFFPDCVD